MELIIKPTGRCNFNCTFCSAANLDIAHPTKLPEQIKELVKKIRPNHIIVTGGEPLTIDPSYYWELQEVADCSIGFTTNLKDFYLHPDKWAEMFRNPNFGVITSFNYGDTRRWDADTPYTEEKFIEVYNLFKDVTGGKTLNFIAVITKSNEDRLMDHVYLAKRLGCKVKINGATKIGRSDENYPRYKMMRAYLDIIKAGLDEYEMTCNERHIGRCSFNTNFLCNKAIRCCYIDSEGKLHYGICDDEVSAGYELPMDNEFPIKIHPVLPTKDEFIHNKCAQCELFRLCHGCNSHRRHIKEFPEHCENMLAMKDEIIASGWAI